MLCLSLKIKKYIYICVCDGMIFLIFLNLLCLVSQKEVTHWSPGSRRLCRCRRFAACWSSLSGSWSAVWWRCPVSWCPPPPQGYWAGSWGLLLQLQGSIWKSTGKHLRGIFDSHAFTVGVQQTHKWFTFLSVILYNLYLITNLKKANQGTRKCIYVQKRNKLNKKT